MKSFFLILIIFTSLSTAEEIELVPPNPKVGQEVTFTLKNPPDQTNQYQWYLNNSLLNSTTVAQLRHLFKDPGNFNLRCQAGSEVFQLNFTVQENRLLEINFKKALVGQELTISGRNFNTNLIRLELGDGRTETTALPFKTSFSNPGTYQIKAFDFNGESQVPVTVQLQIVPDNRQIELITSQPSARQKILFRARNFNSENLLWDFGDGSKQNDRQEVYHFYEQPGNYEISVTEIASGLEPIKKTIQVLEDNRLLSVLTPEPLITGYSIRFKADNFSAFKIRWDFGDGQSQTAGNQIEHTYSQPGFFEIKAYEEEKPDLFISKKIQIRLDNRGVQVRPESIIAGTETTIEALYFFSTNIFWDFGDGTTLLAQTSVRHIYKQPGYYRGKAIDFNGQDRKYFEFSVRVNPDNRELIVPQTIIEQEELEIKLINATHDNFIWNIGNESPASGRTLKKSLSGSGTKKIRIIDPTGLYPPLEKEITILPDNRQLIASKNRATIKEEISFQAVNFLSDQILWNFSGSTQIGSKNIRHAFLKPGNYQVLARDLGGKSNKIFSTNITVVELDPEFKINALELQFKNGKYFQLFSLNSPPQSFLIKIKAEKRGLLKGKILLNEKTVLSVFQLEISEGETLIWDSATANVFLPTNISGLHTITVQFTNYNFSSAQTAVGPLFLRYFVSSGTGLKIIHPENEARFPEQESIKISWQPLTAGLQYQIAISEIPFPFLKEEQIKWQEINSRTKEYSFKPEEKKRERWLYIQVRALRANKIEAMSEIVAVKLF